MQATGDIGLPVVAPGQGQVALAYPANSGIGTLGNTQANFVDRWSTWQWGLLAASLIATPLLAYHGYKRNHSVGWAVGWGLLGGIAWPIVAPIAFAQGFGKSKGDRSGRRKNRGFRSR